MAGCFSVVADLMDETKLPPHHANKLIREILKPDTPFPHWDDKEAYLQAVGELAAQRPKGFDFYTGCFRPQVNVKQVRSLMWWHDFRNSYGSGWSLGAIGGG